MRPGHTTEVPIAITIYEKDVVAMVEYYTPYKRNPMLIMHIPTVTIVTRKL